MSKYSPFNMLKRANGVAVVWGFSHRYGSAQVLRLAAATGIHARHILAAGRYEQSPEFEVVAGSFCSRLRAAGDYLRDGTRDRGGGEGSRDNPALDGHDRR